MNASLKGHYAGFVSRLLAYSIDLAVITVALVATGWLISTANRLVGGINISQTYPQLKTILTGAGALLFTASYFILFWTAIGQTPGKILLGVRIVGQDGKRISFLQAIIRYLGYLLSTLALFLGFGWILIDNRRQGWHDKLARTFVVYNWDARQTKLLANRTDNAQEGAQTSEETPAQA
jgi:uncharacterized RDD family membrane protein YckC